VNVNRQKINPNALNYGLPCKWLAVRSGKPNTHFVHMSKTTAAIARNWVFGSNGTGWTARSARIGISPPYYPTLSGTFGTTGELGLNLEFEIDGNKTNGILSNRVSRPGGCHAAGRFRAAAASVTVRAADEAAARSVPARHLSERLPTTSS
jgi:hypothetical protein